VTTPLFDFVFQNAIPFYFFLRRLRCDLGCNILMTPLWYFKIF